MAVLLRRHSAAVALFLFSLVGQKSLSFTLSSLPEPPISKLTSWARIIEVQDCPGGCRDSLNESSCVMNRVCSINETCNGRTDFPALDFPLKDWVPVVGGNGCKINSTDLADPPPTVFPFVVDDRTLVVNGSGGSVGPCNVHQDSSADVFTLVAWLSSSCNNCSVLGFQSDKNQLINIRVVNNRLCLNLDCPSQGSLQNTWTMISVRVIRTKMDVFLDDTLLNFSPLLQNLNINHIIVGSETSTDSGNTFSLYNVRFFRDALTLRELKQLRTGMTNTSVPYVACQCPANWPEEAGDNTCTDGSSMYPRYNSSLVFYGPEVILDGDTRTNWASSDHGLVTLTLSFNKTITIESIRVTLLSTLSYLSPSYHILTGDVQNSFGSLVCKQSTCVAENITGYGDTISIALRSSSETAVGSFILTDIDVTGRCNCNNLADVCTVNYENQTYECHCNPATHTQGQHCLSCSDNYFQVQNESGCSQPCDCSADGVANISKKCEEMNGSCICKENVEGIRCDMCKPFSYSLTPSASKGCEDCKCNPWGSLSCSNITGVCKCKSNVQSPLCDQCVPGYFGFNSTQGCQPCGCSVEGTVCNRSLCGCDGAGQCPCKVNVQGTKCAECKPGYYQLESINQQGCKPCDCHPVGRDANTCDLVTGRCRCRGDVNASSTCAPSVSSVDPTFGPLIGGTEVTIYGSLLGNASHNLAVFLNETQQDLILVSDTKVTFRTRPVINSSTQHLRLSWREDSRPFDTQVSFTYWGKPVVDIGGVLNVSTFVSGGCLVKVFGSNLRSVKYPKLEAWTVSNPGNRTSSVCFHATDHTVCPTPNLGGITWLASDKLQMVTVFDGVTSSLFGDIKVNPDPVMEHVGTIRFQYPFEDAITLKGKGLLGGCSNELKVLTGVVACTIQHITDSEIRCAPSVSAPGGFKNVPIQVFVGNYHATVGALQYLELRETTGFIIIISCVSAGLGLILIALAVVWFLRRKRRQSNQQSSSPPLKSEDKKPVTKEVSPLSVIPEVPLLAEELPVLRNGHLEPVQKETVFREPKKGIVNTESEDSILKEEFLPKVDADLREDLRQCFVGGGHFVLGRHCALKGNHAQLIDGSLQKSGTAAVKLTIKSVIRPITESELPDWAHLALVECLRLRNHKHNHLLTILGVGVSQQQFHILYPRMSNYVLKTFISDGSKELNVRQLLDFAHQVSQGLVYLASKGVTHKDVATRNCMINEGNVVRLCDSSFSMDFFEEEYIYDSNRERYLPVRWMSPESLRDGYYDMRSDVWSFGVFVWELLTRGCLPYHEVSTAAEISDFVSQGYILGKPEVVGDNLYDLLCDCWNLENEQRPKIDVVSETLADISESQDYASISVDPSPTSITRSYDSNGVVLRRSKDSDTNKPKLSRA